MSANQVKNAKRQIKEVLQDSMEETIENIESLCAKKNPEIKDVLSGIGAIMKMMMKREQRDEKTSDKIDEIFNRVSAQNMDIQSNKNEIDSISVRCGLMEKKCDEYEKSLNLMDQKRVDNDIFLSQFKSKPNDKMIAQNLLQLANIPLDSLVESYSIPLGRRNKSTPKRENVSYGIVVSLKDFSHKKKFLEFKKNSGELKWGQLDPTIQQQSIDMTIKCANRLSAFNTKVLRTLISAKKTKQIVEFKFQNGLYRCKISTDANWKIIGLSSDLLMFHQEEDSMIQIVDN